MKENKYAWCWRMLRKSLMHIIKTGDDKTVSDESAIILAMMVRFEGEYGRAYETEEVVNE